MNPGERTIARVNAGHSIRGLARTLGVSEQIVRRVEAGEQVRPESAKPLADFYGITVAELLGISTDQEAAWL